MKKLILTLTFLIFSNFAIAAIVTINDKKAVDNPMRETIYDNIDANFTDLDTTKLDTDGDGGSITGIVPGGIEITNNSMLYGDVSVGSEVALTADTFPGVDTGSVIAISGDGTYTGIASGILDVDLIPVVIQFPIGSETEAITTGTEKLTFRMPYDMTLTSVRASVATAPTGGSEITVDINEGGTTVLSTKLTIDSTEKTSTTAAVAAVISDSSLADDAEITIDYDQVGNTIAGSDLVITLGGTRAL